MTNLLRHRPSLAIATLLAVAVSGCHAVTVTDKTGAGVVTLRLATIDKLDPNGQTVAPAAFVRSLELLSGGQLKATVQVDYGSGSASAESDLVRSIAAGTLDGGWPSTRAFGRAGVHGLAASEAPLLITSYAAEKATVSGPAGQAMLHTLDATTIVGLSLAVGPLRRPFAVRDPLIKPASWRGTTVRAFNSDTEGATIRALGGRPVDASYHFPELMHTGKLGAVELDIAQYALNNYGTLAPMAARNVVLWPKMLVIAFNRGRFNALTAQERSWVRRAAEQATTESINYDYDETTPADRLCESGVRFIDASPGQLASLASRVAPVLAALADDPIEGPVLDEIRAAVADHPGIDAPDVPASCRRVPG